MGRKQENTAFICANCQAEVLPVTNGSYRNHCPFCLFSQHVDHQPGDRQNVCAGLMQPVGLTYKSQKGYQIIHRCLHCGAEKVNKVAADTIQPDDIELLSDLASGYDDPMTAWK